MAERLNILLTSIGRRVALLETFRKAMAELGIRGRLYGADRSSLAAALYVADEGFLVPGVNSTHYGDAVLEICRRHKVGLVVPLIDTELLTLSKARDRFAAGGARVLLSSHSVVTKCRDKQKTFEFLSARGVGTPKVLSYNQALKGKFPVIVKERGGSSTRNVRLIDRPSMLKFVRSGKKVDWIIQEYVPGREFTVDVYADFGGVPRVAVPRERIQVRAGEVMKARTVRHGGVIREAMRLVEALEGCVGVITAQCRLTADEQVKFFDVNPRFGGGVPLSIAAGADFPRWIIEEHLGRKPQIDPDAWEEGLVMLRYDAAVFRRPDELYGNGDAGDEDE